MNQLKGRVAQWARAQETLEQVRVENTRSLNTREAIAALRSATKHAISNSVPRTTSGLVEQQVIFQRISSR